MKIALCVPLSWDMVYADFWRSSMRLDDSGLETKLFDSRHPAIDWARNDVVVQALKWEPDYLFWMDADQTYPSDTIKRLLAHQKDFVGGVNVGRKLPHNPLVYQWKEGDRMHHILDLGTGLKKVEVISLSGSLISSEVFKAIPQPWFTNTLTAGHDVLFCLRCSDFGFDIYCDTSLIYGHIVPKVLTTNDMKLPRFGTIKAGMRWKELKPNGFK